MLNKQEAKDFCNGHAYDSWTPRQIAEFQLHQELLCFPFEVYHKAVEIALGRPVWTHEFAFPDRLIKELEGITGKPSMAEIINLLPADKTIIVKT